MSSRLAEEPLGRYDPEEDVDAERQRLVECLRRHRWSTPRAAQELGMHRTTLWRKVKRLGIRPSRP
jgi:transcriptional regulator of acetoin/glycerol metabolism